MIQFDEFEKLIQPVEEKDWRIWTLGQESNQKANVVARQENRGA